MHRLPAQTPNVHPVDTKNSAQPSNPLVTHRLALTIHSLEYHWWAVSIYLGMGPRMPSWRVALLKKQLLRPSSTSLRSLSTSA